MALVYDNPVVKNMTKDRLVITMFRVETDAMSITINYVEGHNEGDLFVPIGPVMESTFAADEIGQVLMSLPNPELWAQVEAALYAMLGTRLNRPGTVEIHPIGDVLSAQAAKLSAGEAL